MIDNPLIIHSTSQPLYCCCYYRQEMICTAGLESIDMWNFLQGNKVSTFRCQIQLSPISITLVRQDQSGTTFLLQNKDGNVMTVLFTQGKISIIGRYQMSMVGFTKIPIWHYSQNQEGVLTRTTKDHFFTIKNRNVIEKRELINGKISKEFMLEQEDQLTDVTVFLQYQIKQKLYMFAAEEGALIKKINLPHKETQAKVEQKLIIPMDKQNKIILSIQPLNHFQALVALRDSCLTIINLEKLSIVKTVNYTFPRLIKTISLELDCMAITGKNNVTILKDFVQHKNVKVQTTMIMDMDVCSEGVLGVTLEGRIFFLSHQT